MYVGYRTYICMLVTELMCVWDISVVMLLWLFPLKKLNSRKSKVSRNSDSSISNGTNPNWDFGLSWICTQELKYLDLVGFGGVALSVESAMNSLTHFKSYELFNSFQELTQASFRVCLYKFSKVTSLLNPLFALAIQLSFENLGSKIEVNEITASTPVQKKKNVLRTKGSIHSEGGRCIPVRLQNSTPDFQESEL